MGTSLPDIELKPCGEKRLLKIYELILGNDITETTKIGSPHWKHSELFFEKKALIPVLQQLLATCS